MATRPCRSKVLFHISTALNEWQCQPASSSIYEARRHNHADVYAQNGDCDIYLYSWLAALAFKDSTLQLPRRLHLAKQDRAACFFFFMDYEILTSLFQYQSGDQMTAFNSPQTTLVCLCKPQGPDLLQTFTDLLFHQHNFACPMSH